MPLPFATTQLYHHSTHTPLVVRLPGRIQANSANKTHMVSAVDILPTLLEITGTDIPGEVQGRSFADLLFGKGQADRDPDVPRSPPSHRLRSNCYRFDYHNRRPGHTHPDKPQDEADIGHPQHSRQRLSDKTHPSHKHRYADRPREGKDPHAQHSRPQQPLHTCCHRYCHRSRIPGQKS